MDTSARHAAPESPIWLLASERQSRARFSRRPWETKAASTPQCSGVEQIWGVICECYLCNMCCPCVTDRIKGQVERQEVLVGRFNGGQSRTDEPSTLVSNPVVSQGQVSEPGGESYQLWHFLGLFSRFFVIRRWLTRCLQRGEGGSYGLGEGCLPVPQLWQKTEMIWMIGNIWQQWLSVVWYW